MPTGAVHIGTSGWDYPGWKGRFYPDEIPRRRWLEHLAKRVNAIELNGTFYSLKRPDHFKKLVAETPPRFVFAVKGGKFITHNKKLRDCETPLANFFASGVLALGEKTGPFLWQLPEMVRFDVERIESFLKILPKDSDEAARLARKHDHRVEGRALLSPSAHVRLRHAFEIRHASFLCEEFYDVLRAYDAAFVVAETAGRFPLAHVTTASFAYVRLHGSQHLYTSRYTDEELDVWAERVRGWASRGLDVHVYFDNDAHGHAPYDAVRLLERVRDRGEALRDATW